MTIQRPDSARVLGCIRRKYKSSAVPTARSNQAPG